ncbi:Methyltransferase domain-containing protein [Filimonas lacunae]|uniref:Methyltransferase domain-containing protein n=1 Tax=Filimonas lacunae TaxID=477680 RepID=A0A173MMF8_9BACT|nr:class I SAM-dependent methyltransferase [Filimonas lacunae]BAV08649.1 hypothetical protein FLA_4696 [Filimonas lacunae]SIS59233.1 Methyltransferase domain-containing protein [Filimonas lacunae]
MKLLTEEELVWSPIVANNRMNRKRNASGVNSYERELKFNPEEFLDDCLKQQGHAKWLDLCCGEGNALLQYAERLKVAESQDNVTLTGVDLVGDFQMIPPSVNCLRFITASLVHWNNEEQYDLVTCVHGIHYIGDKLKALSVALKAVKSNGMLIADLDWNSIKIEGDKDHQYLKTLFRENDIDYNARRKLVRCKGTRNIHFSLTYIGADDKAGPNYTGQEAVDSYYVLNVY